MGGVHGKPLSTIDRESRRLEKEIALKFREQLPRGEGVKLVVLTEELLERAREIVRGSRVVTPYTLLSKMDNITYGVAKDILERLESEGVVRLVSRNRRVSIYVPAGSPSATP